MLLRPIGMLLQSQLLLLHLLRYYQYLLQFLLLNSLLKPLLQLLELLQVILKLIQLLIIVLQLPVKLLQVPILHHGTHLRHGSTTLDTLQYL